MRTSLWPFFIGAVVLVMLGLGAVLTKASSQALTPQVQRVSLQDVEVTIYTTPTCSCCTRHAEALSTSGMTVKTVSVELDELMAIRAGLGVPMPVLSCHVAVVEGYALEGHVPVEAIEELLAERPDIDGIALPGMPAGSPGMGGVKVAPFRNVSNADCRS